MHTKRTELELLLDIIDQAYERRAWHGVNLRGSIRGLDAKQATWRPGLRRHNIWEIVVHCAYWKYAVRRRILGERRGSFPLQGSNWFRRPVESTDATWRADVHLLQTMHKDMRDIIMSLSPARLHKIQGNTRYTYAQLIYGIASHDLYHAGQIQLLKKLQSK